VYHAGAILILLLTAAAHAQMAVGGAIPKPVSKTFMVILAHHDDHGWEWGFGGWIARLTAAGWTGYYVRTTNDEKDSGVGWGKGDQINLKECRDAAAILGIKDVISLNWRNDHMSSIPLKELRANYILLLRKYRPDIVMTFDPWGHYDRNPDHRRVARAMGEAMWLAGLDNVHPEHADLGLKPFRPPHVYYGQRQDYGLGHTPNLSIKLTSEEQLKKGQAFWAHKNVRGNRTPDPPMTPGSDGTERYYYRGEWDHLPGLKDVLP
jgi:LmbE family N-acetylglucosaminyl deacetylase